MRSYMKLNAVPDDGFANFAVNAHINAHHNPNALFRKRVSARKARSSRIIVPPLRLFDSAPVCDGAAAVVLAPAERAPELAPHSARLLACSVSTDRFRVEDRADPLWLQAAEWSAQKAYESAELGPEDIDFFELHDAFSIMAAMQLEAAGFAARGEGWKLAAEKKIYRRRGKIPIATMGGLKARGHPVGASALYQAVEIVLQLTGRAGKNQLRKPKVGMMQSVGGAGSTMLTHIFAAS
jgi:acetyl-CoA C-acetyltransferase